MGGSRATFPRIVVVGSALPFLGIGAAFLVAPAGMGGLVDVALASATARQDLRAVHGGLQLGVGALLLGAGLSRAWLRAGLALELAAFGGLALGRLVSLIADGAPSALGLALWGAELVGLSLGVVAWRARAF
jgi:hypothetical protein